MSAKSAFLNQEVGLLECYGKNYSLSDDDCAVCEMRGDCKTLTGMRRKTVVAKKPKARMPRVSLRPKPAYHSWEEEEYEEEDSFEDEMEEEYDPRQYHYPWGPSIPQPIQPYQSAPYPPPPPPGLYSSASMIPHPAPHLTYMYSHPVDCPMPMADESWVGRIGKNVLSGALSEGGRQVYEFFRRFRF